MPRSIVLSLRWAGTVGRWIRRRQEDDRQARRHERADRRPEPDHAQVVATLVGPDQRHQLEVALRQVARRGRAAGRSRTARRSGRSAPSAQQPRAARSGSARSVRGSAAPGRPRRRRPARACRGCSSPGRCRQREPTQVAPAKRNEPNPSAQASDRPISKTSRASRLAPTGTSTARSARTCACSTRVLGCVEVLARDVRREFGAVRVLRDRAVAGLRWCRSLRCRRGPLRAR